ncbi:MAG: hypothetical protein NTU53_25490 [Planctomycetota bacterium]|nr:hypothetical protein [Planctomycetota bacterium]
MARRAKVVVYCLFVALHRPRKTRTAESSTLLGKGLKHTTVLKSNGVKWVIITNRMPNNRPAAQKTAVATQVNPQRRTQPGDLIFRHL